MRPGTPKPPPKLKGFLPRTLGQIMVLVALSALGITAILPRPVPPPKTPPKGFRIWRAPRALPVPLPQAPPFPQADRFLHVAPTAIDEAILVEAPRGIDEAMIVDPAEGRGARSGVVRR